MNTKKLYPSKILDESSLKGIPTGFVKTYQQLFKKYEYEQYEYTNEISDNAGVNIMNNVLDVCSKFLQMEKRYNINSTYNFGFLPYHFMQKLMHICTKAGKNTISIHNAVELIISEYIINTVNYRYTIADRYKVKLLLLHIIIVMLRKEDLYKTELFAIGNVLDYNIILRTVYDTFSYTKQKCTVCNPYESKFAEKLINDVIQQVVKVLNTDHTMFESIELYPNEPKMYTVLMWMYIFTVNSDNIDDYKSSLGSYYEYAKKVLANEVSFEEQLNTSNELIENGFKNMFNELDMYFGESNDTRCGLKMPINVEEELCKICGNIYIDSVVNNTPYQIYIYTSFMMYNASTMVLPSIKDYDSGNGRTAEFLASKVYEDMINYCIFNYHRYNNIVYTKDSYKEWQYIKKQADSNTIAYTSINNVVVLNTVKFLTKLIETVCPDTFHPSVYNFKHSYCHFITDKGWLNIYNIFNIDASYIIIKSNKRYKDNDFVTLLDWAQNIQVIFRPLKNLSDYYYKIDDPKDYYNYTLTYSSNLLSTPETEAYKVNKHETGGDLYSIFDKTFYLIDFKKYDLTDKTDAHMNNTYLRTLVQCWMYMNMYYYPLCNVVDNNNNKMILYNNYYLSVMNPLHSHIVINTYKNINSIVTPEIRAKYVFTESPKELITL